RELLPDDIDAVKIRHHGDFHLGQMLIVKDDVVIIDFEGEPRRSIEERRRKAPAARDVAGLIRSIDYSAISERREALAAVVAVRGSIARLLPAGEGVLRDRIRTRASAKLAAGATCR